MHLTYTVLENGLDFIRFALDNVADTEQATDDATKKRLLKYALLHLSSGIELVLKYRLFQEHWTYVFSDMNTAKRAALESGDFKSADSETIIKRLSSLCDIEIDEKNISDLKQLRNKRNKIEHFEFKEPLRSVEISIHKCITIITEFIAKHYSISTFSEDEKMLFHEIKQQLRAMDKHFDDLRAIAQKELDEIGVTDAITCPECWETFLVPGDGELAHCHFCEYESTGEQVALEYTRSVMGIDEYAINDGENDPICDCPECGQPSLVFDYNQDMAVCFNCGTQYESRNMEYCSSCGTLFVDDDEGIGICDNCFEYKMSKD